MKLPVVANPCPADGHTQRAYVKNLIRQINLDHPGAKNSFFMQYYMEISPDGRQMSLRKRRIQFVYERKSIL